MMMKTTSPRYNYLTNTYRASTVTLEKLTHVSYWFFDKKSCFFSAQRIGFLLISEKTISGNKKTFKKHLSSFQEIKKHLFSYIFFVCFLNQVFYIGQKFFILSP